jgi:hypothetical protein
MWWHLKTGEIIWNTHSIPRVDPFSFTAYGHPWIAQEWLSEWTMYGAWKLGGYTGLMLWFAGIAVLLVIAAYLLCTLYSGNCKIAFLGAAAFWFFSTIGLSVRPHMLGYVLFMAELLALQLGRTKNPRWLLAIPPVIALWINLHSSYFLGLVVLAAVLFFAFIEFEIGLLVSRPWPRQKRRMLSIAFGLSLLAAFANPIGWKLVRYPVDNMLHQGVNFNNIQEWQQIDFSDPRGIALFALGALVLLLPLLRAVKLHAIELVLVSLAFWLAVHHARMLFIFGILVAPVLCRLLATAWDGYDPRRDNSWAAAVMLTLVLGVSVLSFPNHIMIEREIEKSNPVKAVEFLKRSGLRGNLLNEFIYGGYLIWAAPERKVAVDGRGDLYEAAGVLTDYLKWTALQADPHEYLEKQHIRICLVTKDAPAVRVLPLLDGWTKVYSDERAAILARKN